MNHGQSQRKVFISLDVVVLFKCHYIQHESSHIQSPTTRLHPKHTRGKRAQRQAVKPKNKRH